MRVEATNGPVLRRRNLFKMRERFTAQRPERMFVRRDGAKDVRKIRGFAPIVSGLRLPRRTPKRPAFNAFKRASSTRVTAHLRSVRMRCIDDQADRFRFKEGLQPFYPTEAAHAYAAREIARHAAQSGEAINVIRTEPSRDSQCVAGAAQ